MNSLHIVDRPAGTSRGAVGVAVTLRFGGPTGMIDAGTSPA